MHDDDDVIQAKPYSSYCPLCCRPDFPAIREGESSEVPIVSLLKAHLSEDRLFTALFPPLSLARIDSMVKDLKVGFHLGGDCLLKLLLTFLTK